MTHTESNNDTKSAMRVFLVIASLVYVAGLFIQSLQKNSFAQELIIFAAVAVVGIVYYVVKKG